MSVSPQALGMNNQRLGLGLVLDLGLQGLGLASVSTKRPRAHPWLTIRYSGFVSAISQVCILGFCQTFVVSASWDKDELIFGDQKSKVKVPASPSVRRADIHDLDAVRRVQISIVSNALRKKHFM